MSKSKPKWIVVSATEPSVQKAEGSMKGRRSWLIASGIISIGGVQFEDIPILDDIANVPFGRYDNVSIAIRPELTADDFIWQKG